MYHQERKKNIFKGKIVFHFSVLKKSFTGVFFLTTLFFQEICLCNIHSDHKKTKQIKNSKKCIIRKERKYFQEIYFSLHSTCCPHVFKGEKNCACLKLSQWNFSWQNMKYPHFVHFWKRRKISGQKTRRVKWSEKVLVRHFFFQTLCLKHKYISHENMFFTLFFHVFKDGKVKPSTGGGAHLADR